jgi:hypothetical protein
VHKWRDFNVRYFENALRPVPLVLTQTLPYGKRLAFCSYGSGVKSGRTITLNVPKDYTVLVADNGVLLHEMIHQYLFERSEDPRHSGAPWRREIMRLSLALTGARYGQVAQRLAGATAP